MYECSDAKESSEKCSTIVSTDSNDNSKVEKSSMIKDGATAMNLIRNPKLVTGSLNKNLFRAFIPATSGFKDVSQTNVKDASGSSKSIFPKGPWSDVVEIDGKFKSHYDYKIAFDLEC